EPLSAQRGEEQGVGHICEATRGCLSRSPLCQRVNESIVAGDPFDLRPAVVTTGFDQVQLVILVVAELTGPQPAVVVEGKALHVAMPVRVCRGLGVGIVRRYLSFGGEPQYGTRQRIGVLGVATLSRVAGADVEHAVRSERHATAV